MKRSHFILFAALFFLRCAASGAFAGAFPVGSGVIVAKPLAPTYGGSDYETELDDEMMYGMAGTVVGGPDKFGRVEIKTQYNYGTYVPPEYFKAVTAAEAQAWKDAQTHWVIAAYADLMPRPDDNAEPLMTLPKGSLLRLAAGEGDKWLKATLHDDSVAYVRAEKVRAKRNLRDRTQFTEDEARRLLVEDALSYIGSTYRWAGKTPAGMDCSGYSGMVYMLNGIDKFRNSRPKEGYPLALLYVPTAEPANPDSTHTLETLAKAKPGDALYWSGHEGFYIGDGHYIHSNASSYNNRPNSLLPNDSAFEAPTRTDLNTNKAIFAWATPFPQYPNEIRVGRFWADKASGERQYRFFARLDGYCPNRIEIYPFGVDASGNPLGSTGTTDDPVVISTHGYNGTTSLGAGNTTANNLRYMLFDSPVSASASVPTFTYPAGAKAYFPAVKFVNDASLTLPSYLPPGQTKIESDVYVMPDPIVITD